MKMQVIEVPQYGPPEVLQVRECATPTAEKGEVLIRVDASRVCRPDLVRRQGFNPPPPGASDVSVLRTCVTKQTGDMRCSEAEPLWFTGPVLRTKMQYGFEK
jgi:hypothetical protein